MRSVRSATWRACSTSTTTRRSAWRRSWESTTCSAFLPRPERQPGGYNNNPQVLCNAQTEKSYAAYGEGNYKITDSTTLTLGARLTRDSKDWIGRQQVFVQQLPSPTGAIVPGFTWQQLGGLMNAGNFALYPFGVVTDSHTWTQPTYRATLSHEFSPTLFGYGTYSHGFKAGGYNDQVGTSGVPITSDEKKPTDPEKADSFEVGMKSELLDHRIRLNEALFYVQYKDAIRQVVVPVTNLNGSPGQETLFRNAAKMTTYGIESELTAQLAQGLLLRLPLSYQHCKYNSFTSGEGDECGRPVGSAGQPLPHLDRHGRSELHPVTAGTRRATSSSTHRRTTSPRTSTRTRLRSPTRRTRRRMRKAARC